MPTRQLEASLKPMQASDLMPSLQDVLLLLTERHAEYYIQSRLSDHCECQRCHRPQTRALLERWRSDMLNATKARHITPDKQNNWTVTDQLALTLIFAVRPATPLSSEMIPIRECSFDAGCQV